MLLRSINCTPDPTSTTSKKMLVNMSCAQLQIHSDMTYMPATPSRLAYFSCPVKLPLRLAYSSWPVKLPGRLAYPWPVKLLWPAVNSTTNVILMKTPRSMAFASAYCVPGTDHSNSSFVAYKNGGVQIVTQGMREANYEAWKERIPVVPGGVGTRMQSTPSTWRIWVKVVLTGVTPSTMTIRQLPLLTMLASVTSSG